MHTEGLEKQALAAAYRNNQHARRVANEAIDRMVALEDAVHDFICKWKESESCGHPMSRPWMDTECELSFKKLLSLLEDSGGDYHDRQ
jgi:hypothetical protein